MTGVRNDDGALVGRQWSSAKRHRACRSRSDIDRSGAATLRKDVTIADYVLPAGSSATNLDRAASAVADSSSFVDGRVRWICDARHLATAS